MNKALLLLLLLALLLTSACTDSGTKVDQSKINVNTPKYDSVYHRVMDSEKIRIITHNNSTGYFVYRGTPMGFHHDLIKLFAKEHNLSVEILVEDNVQRAMDRVRSGEVDICAFDITETRERSKKVLFTYPIGYNRQVLVQRNRYGKKRSDKSMFVKKFIDLDTMNIYVQQGAIFTENLIHLKDISATNVNIIEDSVHTMEELIQLVAEGEIDYTACDERIAKANSVFSGNIDYSLHLSINQKLAWVLAHGSDSLLIAINNWLIPFSKTKKFAVIRNKYFKAQRKDSYTKRDFSPLKGGDLSPYDRLIKKYAKEIDWDWRLLAAVIYQESRFNNNAGSWAGAQGLMQLMPAAATKFGVTDATDPEQNIRAGARYLKLLQNRFSKDSTICKMDQIKFALASYNVGYGHVVDARKLASKHNGRCDCWTGNVDTFMLLKQKPQYYNDPVVKYGYCRGSEPYKYVSRIMSVYNDYKNVISK